MPGKKQVICAGIIVADHVCSPISHVPAEGELVPAESMFLTLGGCAANVAVDLVKLGVNATPLGKVGDDALGHLVLSLLKSRKVESSQVICQPGLETSQTLIINVKGQDRRFVHSVGANAEFSDKDLTHEIAEQADLFYLGGYLLMKKLSSDHLASILHRVQKRGGITVLDVVTPGPGDYLPLLQPVLPYVDYFFPNEDEGQLITGIRDPLEQGKAFRKMGARNAIITLGSKGTILCSQEGSWRAGIFPVQFVDGSGSGDAFAAGFISGLLEGKNHLECLTLGSAAGASCVRGTGTTEFVFTQEECHQFIQNHSLGIEKIA
ncbi:MAG: carbohydrate kinase family protein [Gemmataceae bacterium]|nr:carbohydrate kinase family protein [Gemmataceae bacterium]